MSHKRDLTIAMSAVGAIFAGLVGTNVLDIGTSNHTWMLWLDHAVIASWLPALLLVGLAAYLGPAKPTLLRQGAWAATALAGVITAVVLLLSGFAFTRDHDRVRRVRRGLIIGPLG